MTNPNQLLILSFSYDNPEQAMTTLQPTSLDFANPIQKAPYLGHATDQANSKLRLDISTAIQLIAKIDKEQNLWLWIYIG